ncbi:hypothetical protein [Desulfonema ishimotonii]|uniref:hypothetical protein n=1 Tax=Desulfonema ishimotonii TaxID=45657 RepID=UPI000F575B0C|nr:hypothetical protein [Desulfonema ishimotonii]
MLKAIFLEMWAYLKVILLSSIVFFTILVAFDFNIISQFIIKSARDWLRLFGIFLASSFGFYWNYFKQNDSEFGEWLHWKGASKIYSRGFIYPIFVYIINIVLLVILSEYKKVALAKITFWCMIYGFITLISLLSTIYNFMKLLNLFRTIHKSESANQVS